MESEGFLRQIQQKNVEVVIKLASRRENVRICLFVPELSEGNRGFLLSHKLVNIDLTATQSLTSTTLFNAEEVVVLVIEEMIAKRKHPVYNEFHETGKCNAAIDSLPMCINCGARRLSLETNPHSTFVSALCAVCDKCKINDEKQLLLKKLNNDFS